VTAKEAAPKTEALSAEMEASVTELISISGKPRDMCIKALKAS